MANILLLCADVITERMAGPAIRYWEFAKTLSKSHKVTLASPNDHPDTLVPPPNVELVPHMPENIDALCDNHDVIVFQGNILEGYERLRRSDKVLVADLYDPLPLEGLEHHKNGSFDHALEVHDLEVRIINDQLRLADYVLCASERQRDLWLGGLMTLRRLNPHNYERADLDHPVVTVPFGIPDFPPKRTGQGLSNLLDNQSDFVMLWGGGIWEWFDPLTVIRAVHRLKEEKPGLRMVFLGAKHPNPLIPIMPMQNEAEKLARELGLYGKEVIFQEGWVKYDELSNYFLDANIGISAHFDTLETYFSFRTRILHYLWAGKPIITTRGDILAQQVEQYGAGITVDYESTESWVQAIRRLSDPSFYEQCVKGVEALAAQYTWSKVTQPLLDICEKPHRSEDIILNGSGKRTLQVYDPEQERDRLQARLDETLNSTSWKLTAPIRWLKTRFL
ncbi:MAG: glycosyltransferase [Pseudomonadota bacterium]